MARRKEAETVVDRYADMRSGRYKKTVKAWQYYSIYDFCRSCGESQLLSDKVAKWCMNKAKDGESYSGDNYVIMIVEREEKYA